MHRCNLCKKDFSRNDVLIRHQKTACRKSKDFQTVFPVKRTHNNTTPQKSIESSSEDGESTPKKRRLDFDDLSENSEQELDDSPDIEFLPGDIAELQNRAKEVLKEFGNGKYDNRNELVTILDNLKARGVIKSEDYRNVNDYLSSKQQSEEEEEKDVESHISDTVQYLIQHDVKAIERLLEIFLEKGGETVEEDVEKLGNLVETWVQASTDEKEEMLKDLKRLLTNIHSSTDNMIKSEIPRVNFIQFEKILNDINENHHRVDEVIQRLNQGAAKEQLFWLNQLHQSKYIDNEQYDSLKAKAEEGNLDLDEVIFQLKQ